MRRNLCHNMGRIRWRQVIIHAAYAGILSLLGLFSVSIIGTAHAQARPPFYFSTQDTAVPPNICAQAGRRALQDAGFQIADLRQDRAIGNTQSAWGVVLCVPLQAAGASGRQRSTAVMMVAGEDADNILAQVRSHFRPPARIDPG